jgi:hypothetical protein
MAALQTEVPGVGTQSMKIWEFHIQLIFLFIPKWGCTWKKTQKNNNDCVPTAGTSCMDEKMRDVGFGTSSIQLSVAAMLIC